MTHDQPADAPKSIIPATKEIARLPSDGPFDIRQFYLNGIRKSFGLDKERRGGAK